MSQSEVRQNLLNSIKIDLMRPTKENEEITKIPIQQYISGIIYPEIILQKDKQFHDEQDNRNQENKIVTVPPRLISACEGGHIQDFSWRKWVGCDNYNHVLKITPSEGESNLEGRCEKCNEEKQARDKAFCNNCIKKYILSERRTIFSNFSPPFSSKQEVLSRVGVAE